jgi:hypothetical protein
MPIYQFRNLKTGLVEEHFRSVARRDCVEPHLQRVTVPQRVGFANASHLREPGAQADVPKAFREYELGGADVHKIERETGFKRESIRRIWNF